MKKEDKEFKEYIAEQIRDHLAEPHTFWELVENIARQQNVKTGTALRYIMIAANFECVDWEYQDLDKETLPLVRARFEHGGWLR
jgi:hypothetical protein